MIFKSLNIKYFIISLSIGLLYVYLLEENKQIIYIYPTPDNIDTYHYKDKSDNCFSYDLEEVECIGNYKTLSSQKIK